MYTTINNITFYYEKYGSSKQTILILPGWGNTRETFKYIINAFQDNYTIYILDYPGLGKSPIPNHPLTIYDYAELIINFMKEQKIKKPIILAHSFGGRIVALLSGHYKIKLDKLILIDIAGIKPKKSLKIKFKEKLYKFLKKITKILPTKFKVTYQKKLLSIFASSDYNNLPQGMHQTFKNIINEDLTEYFKEIINETLILWGNEDTDTPLNQAYKIKELIKNSALIILKNAPHFSYLVYPSLTTQIIYEFIK